MKLFDHTLDGWASNNDIERTVRFISEYAEEVATEQNKPVHSRLFKVYKELKINVWYDFGADYFYFESVA